MTFDTHPKLHKSKKECIVVDGREVIVRKVEGKHISEEMEHKEELEEACREALAKYGVIE